MKKIGTLMLFFVFVLSACQTDAPAEKAIEKAIAKAEHKPAATPAPKSKPANNIAALPLETPNEQLVYLSKIFRQYNTNGKASPDKIKMALAKVDNKDLSFIKQFVFESTQQSSALLSNTFLKKPSKDNLKRIYKLRHVNWNSMSLTGVTAAVIDTFDINSVNNEELLTAYYRLLAESLQPTRNQNANLADVNIDLNKIGLENNREKSIVFYTITEGYSRVYNRYLKRIKSDCVKAKELVSRFPRINGKEMFNAIPPKFKDFKVMIGNGAKDKNFSDFFTVNFGKGVEHYKSCK